MTNIFIKSIRDNNIRVRFCAIIFGILFMASIPTDSMGQNFEVTPFAGYRFGGSFVDSFTGVGLDIKDSESYGVVIGINTSPETQIEFLYSHQTTEIEPEGFFSPTSLTSLEMDTYHLGGSYIWDSGKDLRPFVQGTVGATHFRPDRAGLNSETRFSFGLGGGVKYYFTKHIGVRLGGRALATLLNSNSAIFCSGGCTIRVQSSTLWQFEGTLGIIFAF